MYFLGNAVSNIYGGRDALVWQWCSENVSLEFTIKFPYKVIDIYFLCICLIETMMEILMHDLLHMICATIWLSASQEDIRADMEVVMYYSLCIISIEWLKTVVCNRRMV